MNYSNILVLFFLVVGSMAGTPPSAVNVGAIFSFNSIIGKASKTAIELDVEDINKNPGLLARTTLNVIPRDTNCSRFFGLIRALELMENEIVAIIGPQSSDTAHILSNIVNELHVPLLSFALSFAATDPTLTSPQFSYFIRTTNSDYFQMKAIADVIDYYGWREVIVIFIDNDYRRVAGSMAGSPPNVVIVSALFSFNSIIGNASKTAFELAVEDINNNYGLLARTTFNVISHDTNCSRCFGLI